MLRPFLLYMAIADAYGMAYEFADDLAKTGPNDLTYRTNPKYPGYRPGRYSDDTQMSWLSAELLLHFNRASLLPELFAEAWVAGYKADPRPGYSKRMSQLLSESVDGRDLMSRIDPSKGTTSGACMRAGVIGLLPRIGCVLDVAATQARITHDTPAGILSAQVAALGVHYMHYRLGPKNDLPKFLDNHLGDWRAHIDPHDPKQGLYIVDKALHSVMASDSLAPCSSTLSITAPVRTPTRFAHWPWQLPAAAMNLWMTCLPASGTVLKTAFTAVNFCRVLIRPSSKGFQARSQHPLSGRLIFLSHRR